MYQEGQVPHAGRVANDGPCPSVANEDGSGTLGEEGQIFSEFSIVSPKFLDYDIGDSGSGAAEGLPGKEDRR
jgi:hypothetical protein